MSVSEKKPSVSEKKPATHLATAVPGALGAALLIGVVASTALTQDSDESLIGLPASDVLGSEDIWENPTFVGGVINGGPTASSEY